VADARETGILKDKRANVFLDQKDHSRTPPVAGAGAATDAPPKFRPHAPLCSER